MKIQTCKRGDVIIEKDSHGTSAYMIKSGKVEVSEIKNNKKTVHALLGTNRIFGEMGLVEDSPISATVTSLEDTKLMVIDRDDFSGLLAKNQKILMPLLKSLFGQVKEASEIPISEKFFTADKTSITNDSLDDVETTECEKSDTKSVILTGLSEKSTIALGGSKMEIRHFPFKIGRELPPDEKDASSDNDLYLRDRAPFNVSKNHLMIYKSEDGFTIADRDSKLGTVVNRKRINDICVLEKPVNEIIVGTKGSPFVFKLEIV